MYQQVVIAMHCAFKFAGNIAALKGSREDSNFIFRGESLVHNTIDELGLYYATPYYSGKPVTWDFLGIPVPVKTYGHMDHIEYCLLRWMSSLNSIYDD